MISNLFFLSAITAAQAYDYPVALAGGAGVDVGLDQQDIGGFVVGRAVFQFPKFSVDLAYREGYLHKDPRMLGGIFFGARHWIGENGWYVREGVAHHHETPMSIMKANPVAATIGASDGITHRTGLELAGGFLQEQPKSYLPLGAGVDFGINYLFDDVEPNFYTYLQLEFALNVGQKGSKIKISQ